VIAYVDKTFLVCDRVFGYSSIVLLEVYILPVRVYLPNWDAPEYLHAAIRQQPIVGELTIEVPRGNERPSRQATLTLRFATLEIQPPRHHLKRATLAPVTIQVVLGRGVGGEVIHNLFFYI